jgi:hypothetical protein
MSFRLGTGKSFIGALIAKVLYDSTNHTILVVTYTNHVCDITYIRPVKRVIELRW